jgi:glucose-1-phosphate thymidylyltransferase
MQREITLRGEYFLADAVNLMLESGVQMRVQRINVWLDAGIPAALLDTNRFLLDHGNGNSGECRSEHLTIVPPVHIHPSAAIKSAVIGPYVSVGADCKIENAILRNCILESEVEISQSILEESILGRKVQVHGQFTRLNVGDNSSINS